MKHRVLIAAALVLVLGAPAKAQDAIVEGPGVEISEGTVVHTTVGVETGVIENVFYQDGANDPKLAPIVRVEAGFAVASQENRPEGLVQPVLSAEGGEATQDPAGPGSSRATPRWDFRASGHVGYEQYVHTDLEVIEQSNLYGGLLMHVVGMPDDPVSFIAKNHLVRDTRPRNFDSLGNLNRWTNDLELGSRWRPGNGALELFLRYENALDYFESAGSAFANRANHLLHGRAEWQFLPITRFFLDTSFGIFQPLSSDQKPGSFPVRAQVGTATAITELTSVRAHVGYGQGFYTAGQDFANVIYGLELGLRYSPVGRATLAYEYDFHDSINANFYRDHAVVAKVDHQISTVLIQAGAQLRLRGYRGVFAAVGPASRDDLILNLRGEVSYLYRDWLAFTGELDFTMDATAYRDALGDDPSYNRFTLMVGGVAAF